MSYKEEQSEFGDEPKTADIDGGTDLSISKPEVTADEQQQKASVIETPGFSDEVKKDYVPEYAKITMKEDWPTEGRVLTIEKVYPQQIMTSDAKLKSTHGEYYKKKLIIGFAESRELTVDEDKIDLKFRELMPSVFYGVKDGEIQAPRIPKACDEEDLTDNFTSQVAKFRYMYLKAHPEIKADQSDLAFVNGLVGLKVRAKKITGKWKDGGVVKQYCKFDLVAFE